MRRTRLARLGRAGRPGDLAERGSVDGNLLDCFQHAVRVPLDHTARGGDTSVFKAIVVRVERSPRQRR